MAHVVCASARANRKCDYAAQCGTACSEEGDKVTVVIKSTEVMLEKN